MILASYREQVARWPKEGRHILAQYDDETVVVYQAYRPEIAEWAVANQQFGGPWSFGRMSWVKPNFLWMMYRCGWASKPGQERVLAVTLKRPAFESMLLAAVPSSFWAHRYADKAAWKRAVESSEVRLQWDPDHAPGGAKQERRAVQLGLRGETLRRYATEDVVRIDDITPLVHAQAVVLREQGLDALQTPLEHVFPVSARAAEVLAMEDR